MFQHLDEILRKLCAFWTLSKILEEISNRVYRAGQRRNPGLFTFAVTLTFTGFGMRVITSGEGFWLDKIAEVSVVYGVEVRARSKRESVWGNISPFLGSKLDRQVNSRYPEHIASSAG